jgi:uncharacterized RDD family membrane protein YckC
MAMDGPEDAVAGWPNEPQPNSAADLQGGATPPPDSDESTPADVRPADATPADDATQILQPEPSWPAQGAAWPPSHVPPQAAPQPPTWPGSPASQPPTPGWTPGYPPASAAYPPPPGYGSGTWPPAGPQGYPPGYGGAPGYPPGYGDAPAYPQTPGYPPGYGAVPGYPGYPQAPGYPGPPGYPPGYGGAPGYGGGQGYPPGYGGAPGYPPPGYAGVPWQAIPGQLGPGPGILWADMGRRFGAILLDAAFLTVAFVVAAFVATVFGVTHNVDGNGYTPAGVATLWIWFILLVAYHPVSWWAFQGTLGQRAIGLRVVRAADGGSLGIVSTLKRFVLFAICSGTVALGIIAVILANDQPSKRTWWDEFSGSVVIRRV